MLSKIHRLPEFCSWCGCIIDYVPHPTAKSLFNELNLMNQYKAVSDIDWQNWIPKERAVLCFIHVDNNLMLIHKKLVLEREG